jgi:hypothetical protein
MIFVNVFNPNPTFTTVTITGLTSGRVPYITTGGLLTDSANLTFDGTNLTCAGTGQFTNLGIGVVPDTAYGIYTVSSAAGTVSAGIRLSHTSQASSTARGIFSELYNNRNGNVSQITGVDFQATFVPLTPSANRTCANMHGGNGVTTCATESGVNYNSTVVNMRCYYAKAMASEAGGGTGVANITTAAEFYADTSVKGAGTITTLYAFYDKGQTAGATNWGCAINTQSYFNANVRIGSTVAPTVALDVTGAGLFSTTLGVTGIATFTVAPIVSTLTAGRVLFAGSSKEIVDDADFTFATDTLTVTKISVPSTITQNSILQQYSGSKTLADGSATSFVDIALAAGQMIGGTVEYAIYATDGTELQCHTGILTFAAVDVGGTLTSDIDEVYLAASETNALSSGTLTDAFTIVDGVNKISLACNANSSLTTPTITLKYTVKLFSTNTITAL